MATWLAISAGDVTGIGPEVTLKALAAELGANDTRYLILGDPTYFQPLNAKLGLDIRPFTGYESSGRIFLLDPRDAALPEHLESGSPIAARAALDWLRDAAKRCLLQEVAGMVTAPLNKESVIRSGQPFVGQTEFLSKLAGASRTAMMLLGHDDRGRWLRVALATTHVPIKDVAGRLQQDRIELAIELAAEACVELGLGRARIGVCGLNPHAGEGGEFGSEEITTIGPAVEAVRSRGIDAVGPFAADTLFYHVLQGEYDAVVAMYHDQGLVPLKMVAFETGVNWTLGLPFIRTSPDHGTAYDLVGKDAANPSSMRAAIRLANSLARR